MASLLYITEYSGMSQSPDALIGQEPNNGDQVVNYAGGATASTALKNNTKYVRLHTDSICSVAFGTAPTATTSNRRMAAGQTEYFQIPVSQAYKVSAVINT